MHPNSLHMKLPNRLYHDAHHVKPAAPVTTDSAAPLDVPRLLTTITDNLIGMIYRCRIDAIWTLEYVSEGCHKLTGYRTDELVFNNRVSYDQITLPEDRERVGRTIRAALEANESFDVEYRILRADGRSRWALERGVGLRDARGQLAWTKASSRTSPSAWPPTRRCTKRCGATAACSSMPPRASSRPARKAAISTPIRSSRASTATPRRTT